VLIGEGGTGGDEAGRCVPGQGWSLPPPLWFPVPGTSTRCIGRPPILVAEDGSVAIEAEAATWSIEPSGAA
jgi:hypothetical protein